MPAEYNLIIKDPSGVKTAEISDFLDLSYTKRVWEPGLLKFKLDGNHNKLSLLVTNAQVEVWRRNTTFNLGWYCDFYGLLRGIEYQTTSDQEYFTATVPGQMTILSWAHVMWADRTDMRSVFTTQPAETIMKTLVNYNVTANASTANGRKISWPASGIYGGVTIETDAGRGNVLDWKATQKNLLTTLQDLAKVAGGDFDLVKTGSLQWQFRFYPGQLGTDRSASVVFSTPNGNMREPKYILDKTNEATVAVVGGRGDAANQQIGFAYGANYDATNNYIETFVHASEQDTAAYLTAKGNEALYKAQSRNKLEFKVLQTNQTRYGLDYFLGDIITANYKNIVFTQKVQGVSVDFRDNGTNNPESISIEMRDK